MRSTLLLTALLAVGCGSDRSRSVSSSSTTANAASTTTSSTTAPATSSAPVPSAAPTPWHAQLLDPELFPSCPNHAPWYFARDDPGTPDNEAARDLARALAHNGLDEAWAHTHLTGGGRLGLVVGGAGHEQDTPTRRSGWTRPLARHVQTTLELPLLQLDYLNGAAGNHQLLDHALYALSFGEGVRRLSGLIDKARAAGVGEVRLYGHSKGGDVVQEVTWLHRHDPLLTQSISLGIPIWSAANLAPDPAAGYGGLERVGHRGTRDYGGKLVVFNRPSDRVSGGRVWPLDTFPGDGHEYKRLTATPAFLTLLEQAFTQPTGYTDRAAGLLFDY